ncbi:MULTISPECIES: oxidoreductase [unclassified Streptomyces]|jgi:NAD(P)-dependent dehydrogenase (short-subunit alcohol dehydrogenase family)|uniref:oxidoreductase n=1 Tax=unclassified Streptomyces TaxID=2593676 RepID=UPI0019087D70|nr:MULTISPECIES: oxidoreductase [unclassified Streptomyces]MCU4745473.1 oxidoreductase [Streptomyces sp. G-5]QQN79524.1 SDR family NAD(P)-dependent oxidoreductase [Streptomyces sp. XC 2026]
MGWTVRDIPDLRGRTIVVTGANSGLGYVTARELARRGAHVVLACRDRRRGAQALERLLGQVPEARAELRLLDLGDLSSVRAFAAGFADQPLDVLINNAGLMAVPYATTTDGFETQFGVNHLGHFALTGLLLDQLLATPGARVVTVSSLLHLTGPGVLSEERHYRRWRAYGRSKTANLLFTHELARRIEASGADLLAAAVHPGYSETELHAKGPRPAGSGTGRRIARIGNRLFATDPEVGATPTLYAATAPDVSADSFTGPSVMGVRRLRGGPGAGWRAPWTRRDRLAERLWERSEELTGVHYDALPPVRATSPE